MPRPPLPQEIINKVKDEWGRDPKQTAKDVHRAIRRKWGGIISLRKVQHIVRELKDQGAGGFEPSEWVAWQDADESPKDTHFLLTLGVQTRINLHRKLYQHEAKWAIRLRPALRNTSFPLQMEIIGLFAERESVSRNLMGIPRTDDLDVCLVFRPWVSRDHWQCYRDAVFLDPSGIPAPAIFEEFEREGHHVFFMAVDALLLKLAWATMRDATSDPELQQITKSYPYLFYGMPEDANVRTMPEPLREELLNILFPIENESDEEDQNER